MRVASDGRSAPEPVTTLDTAGGELGHAWPRALPNGKGVLYNARGGIFENQLITLEECDACADLIRAKAQDLGLIP